MPRRVSAGDILDRTAIAMYLSVTRDQMASILKHTVADGEYAITGPGIEMRFHRACGITLAGGVMDSTVFPVRNFDECKQEFGDRRSGSHLRVAG